MLFSDVMHMCTSSGFDPIVVQLFIRLSAAVSAAAARTRWLHAALSFFYSHNFVFFICTLVRFYSEEKLMRSAKQQTNSVQRQLFVRLIGALIVCACSRSAPNLCGFCEWTHK